MIAFVVLTLVGPALELRVEGEHYDQRAARRRFDVLADELRAGALPAVRLLSLLDCATAQELDWRAGPPVAFGFDPAAAARGLVRPAAPSPPPRPAPQLSAAARAVCAYPPGVFDFSAPPARARRRVPPSPEAEPGSVSSSP